MADPFHLIDFASGYSAIQQGLGSVTTVDNNTVHCQNWGGGERLVFSWPDLRPPKLYFWFTFDTPYPGGSAWEQAIKILDNLANVVGSNGNYLMPAGDGAISGYTLTPPHPTPNGTTQVVAEVDCTYVGNDLGFVEFGSQAYGSFTYNLQLTTTLTPPPPPMPFWTSLHGTSQTGDDA